jgi:hypothetical protein
MVLFGRYNQLETHGGPPRAINRAKHRAQACGAIAASLASGSRNTGVQPHRLSALVPSSDNETDEPGCSKVGVAGLRFLFAPDGSPNCPRQSFFQAEGSCVSKSFLPNLSSKPFAVQIFHSQNDWGRG